MRADHQTYSDMHRFRPVIEAIDALGVRDNTYIVSRAQSTFSLTWCLVCWHGLHGLIRLAH